MEKPVCFSIMVLLSHKSRLTASWKIEILKIENVQKIKLPCGIMKSQQKNFPKSEQKIMKTKNFESH